MDLNIRDLPYVIYACFVLHNFCEEHNETVGEELISSAMRYEHHYGSSGSSKQASFSKDID